MLLHQDRALIDQLAAEGRRVVSDWRAAILLRRATATTPPTKRSWRRAPREVEDVRPLLRQLEKRGDLIPIDGSSHIFQVAVPYAGSSPIDNTEILLEINPYAAISHNSALLFHGLTVQFPRTIFVVTPSKRPPDMFPADTAADEWLDIQPPTIQKPNHVRDESIHWGTLRYAAYFGIAEYRPRTYPIRATDVERTLLDGLREPDLCGGIDNVLRAWVTARDLLNVGAVIAYVERFGTNILRQRAGFVLEQLRLQSPVLDDWKSRTRRGGSSKLVAAKPYASEHSEAWNLSLNGPVEILCGIE